MELTEEQLAIVKHDADHARVTAVAGSGKTHTMIARVVELLAQGNKAQEILVLMFNKTAQQDFEQRLIEALEEGSPTPEVRTFHSLGYKLSQSFMRQGWLADYQFESKHYIQEALATEAINTALEMSKENDEINEKKTLEDFLSFIDLVKSDLQDPKTKFNALLKTASLDQKNVFFIQAYNIYEKNRKAKRINFFSDLLYNPVQVLKKSEYASQAAKFVGNRMKHIIVDEYQDVNEIQQEMLKFIAGDTAKVMVVGDVDQCIYEWRGAKPEYMLKSFAKDFPSLKTYKLSTTFRYGQELSSVANKLISHNKLRDKTKSVSFKSLKTNIIAEQYENSELGLKIINFLKEINTNSQNPKSSVILLRLYSMSISIELELLKAGINYRLEGREAVLEIKEIKALNILLRLLDIKSPAKEFSKDDFEAFFAVPNIAIKRKDLTLIQEELLTKFEKLKTNQSKIQAINQTLSSYINKAKIHPFVKKNVIARMAALKALEQKIFSKQVLAAAQIMSNYMNSIKAYDSIRSLMRSEEEAEDKIRIIESFIDYAEKYKGDFMSFHKEISSLEGTELASQNNPNQSSILITSIHRAKGLEWNNVIVPSLREGDFPYKPQSKPGDFFQNPQIEAERRLFYVAITRARKNLFLLYPKEDSSRFMREARLV